MIHDAHFFKKNGKFYCNKIDYNLILKFSFYFDQINIVVKQGTYNENSVELDIKNINVTMVKSITNIKNVFSYFSVYKKIKITVEKSDAVYCRGINGIIANKVAYKKNIPSITYLGGCVYDSAKLSGSKLKRVFAKPLYLMMKKSVEISTIVVYCSKYLVKKYPTKGKKFFWTGVEINDINDEIIKKRLNKIDNMSKINIGLIGHLKNNIKGIDTAIKAIRLLDEKFKLKILGPGDPNKYKTLIVSKKVKDRVCFCGTVKGGKKVLEWLDDIDIYIQPSLTEGLPKATIEAMSRGCPVISSNVGGLIDIVNNQYIIEPGDYKKLALLIKKLSEDKKLMKKLSKYSFDISNHYSLEKLDRKFNLFVSYLTNIIKEQN